MKSLEWLRRSEWTAGEAARPAPGASVARREATGLSDAARVGVLFVLWLASALTYYVLLLRPYGLRAHLGTPRLSLGVISHREPRAAAGFLLCFLFTFLLYAAAYRVARNWRSRLGVTAVLVMGALSAVLLAFVYPIGATDVFDYLVQGEMLALRGVNPLAAPPVAAANLQFLRYAAYPGAVSPYGPLWISLQAAVIKVAAPGGLLALTLGFKALAILGYLFACALIAGILAGRAPQLVVAGLLAFAWNPLVLTEVAVNAHNDIWAAALVLAGVLFWESKRPIPVMVSLTLAVLVKPFVAPLLPLFALAAWRKESTAGRIRLLVGGAIAMAALVAIAYLSLPQGVQGMKSLEQRTDLYTHSLPALMYFALAKTMPTHNAAVYAGAITAGLLAGYVLLQWMNAWEQPKEVVRLAFNTLLFLMLLCMPWFQPWYLVSVMALAAIYPRANAPFQAGLWTACVVVSYVVFGFVWFWAPSLSRNLLYINSLAVATSFALPWGYAIWSGLRGRRLHELESNPAHI